MKIAYDPEKGTLILADIGAFYQTLKSIGTLRWNRQRKTLEGSADLETLNRLAAIAHLPPNVEAARQRMRAVQDAIDRERNDQAPKPLTNYPVKLRLFAHQCRAANMAMLAFGLVEPRGVEK